MNFKDFINIDEIIANKKLLQESQGIIEKMLRQKFPEVRLVMKETDDNIELTTVLIQAKRRNHGEFRRFMNYAIELADKFGKTITLEPSDIYGADLDKLKKFYKSLGFKEQGKLMIYKKEIR